MALDQAATLRGHRVIPLPNPRRRRVIALSGGKGGVGKSTLAVNLACASTASGARTLLFDGDLGMADLNLLLGVAPQRTLVDVLEGTPAEQVLIEAHGLHLLPALNGSYQLANLGTAERQRLLGEINALTQRFDTTIIDTAAGLQRDTMALAAAADDIVVVATPEPLSLADAYACLKVLATQHGVRRAMLLPNQVHGADEAETIARQLGKLVDRFLDIELCVLPFVAHDPHVRESAVHGVPVVRARPDGTTSRALKRVLRELDTHALARVPGEAP